MIELKSIRHHRGRLLAAVSAVLALVAVVKWTTGAVYAADTARSAGERIITVHDGGEQKGIVTTASTLREALQQAGIRIDSRDITEPGLDEPLVASSYEANIYRARAVAVKDGAKTTRVITAYRTAKQIAKQAGLTLSEADIASLQPSQNIVEDGAAEVLTIDWATPVTLTFYGKTIKTSTRAKTVGDMLTSMRIIPTKQDTIVPAVSTLVSKGMAVQLWRNGKQTVTIDEDIAFTTRQINDANHEHGYKAIQTQGVNGKRTVTYEIVMRDGKEVERKEVNSVSVKEAVEQVEVVGVKGMYTTPSENESITWGYLIGKGLTREQAAGIMGNLMQEHKFNTTGDGLAQWTGSRQTRLQSMYPDTYMTIYSQLDYLWYELSGPYASVLSTIRSNDSVEAVVLAFQNKYEKCNPTYCRQDLRIQYAYNILASH